MASAGPQRAGKAPARKTPTLTPIHRISIRFSENFHVQAIVIFSCWPLAVTAAIGGASSAYANAKPSQEVIEARQESQIWTTYALSPYLRANDLKVSVHEGKQP